MQNSKIMQRLTPTKISIQNENINILNNKKTPKKLDCMNHPGKRAKYCMPKDLSVSLCSKCAVNMIGKGFQVEEIDSQEETYRKKQIQRFLQQVNAQIPQIDRILTGVLAKKEDIQKYYENQKDKIQRQYIYQKEQLELQKENAAQQLHINYKYLSKIYDDTLTHLQNSKQESQAMQKDIEHNIERIIKQIFIQPFVDIMQSYNKNLQVIQQQIEDIQRKPIEVLKVNDDQNQNKINFFNIGSLKTSLIKKSLQESVLKTLTNESIYVSFENKEQFTFPRQSIKQQFNLNTTPKTQQIPIKNIDLFQQQQQELQLQKQQEQQQQYQQQQQQCKDDNLESCEFQEGNSQMIERDDVENSYQMLLYESSESENDNDQHNQLNLVQTLTHNTRQQMAEKLKIYSSPQFKDH